MNQIVNANTALAAFSEHIGDCSFLSSGLIKSSSIKEFHNVRIMLFIDYKVKMFRYFYNGGLQFSVLQRSLRSPALVSAFGGPSVAPKDNKQTI